MGLVFKRSYYTLYDCVYHCLGAVAITSALSSTDAFTSVTQVCCEMAIYWMLASLVFYTWGEGHN